MIQNLIFGILFLKNIISSIHFFYICPDVAVNFIREFFQFQIFLQKVSKPTKLAKKITHFTIKFRSKNLTHITNLNSPDIENNMLPQHSQRPFSLYKFSIKHVSVWCQKKHLYCTLFRRPRTAFLKHFEIKCLYISVYLLKKMFFPKKQ